MSNPIDKELIAMCSDERIQIKWEEEKLGDNVFLSSNNSMHIVSEIKSLDVETVGIKLSGLTGYYEMFLQDDIIFIPRIEDVLEWLGATHHDLIRRFNGVDISWQEIDTFGNEYLADIPIKALLQAFMHLEHSATWDGNTWTK